MLPDPPMTYLLQRRSAAELSSPWSYLDVFPGSNPQVNGTDSFGVIKA